ncbi:hypothetical protein R5R35_007512 [Gryllus longicercus]
MAHVGMLCLAMLLAALGASPAAAAAVTNHSTPATHKVTPATPHPLQPQQPSAGTERPLAEVLAPDLELLAQAIAQAVSELFAGAVPPIADMISVAIVRFLTRLLMGH